MTITAASVSAALHRLGIQALPSGTSRSREGIRITRGWTRGVVSIAVDIDARGERTRLADAVEEALTELGFIWHRHGDDNNLFNVTREDEETTLSGKRDAASLVRPNIETLQTAIKTIEEN